MSCEGALVTDEHSIMPIALHMPGRFRLHVPDIPLSPLALATIAMGTVGITVQQLSWVYPSSSLAMAAHSDLGQIFAIVNAAGVFVTGLSLLMKSNNERRRLALRERTELNESRNSQRMPDSDEITRNGSTDADQSKMDRIRRRREEMQ